MNSLPTGIPRRKFLATGVAALALAPMPWLRGQSASPNGDVVMGVIGCGGQGIGNIHDVLPVREVVARMIEEYAAARRRLCSA